MSDCIITRHGSGVVTITFEDYKVYGDTVTRTTPAALSAARYALAGASVGDYALFAGGSGPSSVVDAYDTDLTRTIPTALSAARSFLAGTSINNYALFAGGNIGSPSAVVDAYDDNLTRTTPTALSTARFSLAGASVGEHALFAGGYAGSVTSVVDAYSNFVSSTYLPITAGSKYKLNSDTEAMASANKFIKVDFPLTGYIKYKGGKFE